MNSFLFFNGNIITMEDNNIYVEAIYIEDGIIKKVGNLVDLEKVIKKDTKNINLNGKTLMPSFIDSHSHITAYANTFSIVSLKECKSYEDIKIKLEEYIKNKDFENTDEWIVGFGYDNNFLKEKERPTCRLLDEVSIDYPIVITHVSRSYGSFKY